jgi:hypothetical protein
VLDPDVVVTMSLTVGLPDAERRPVGTEVDDFLRPPVAGAPVGDGPAQRAFGQTLPPIMGELGVDPGKPQVAPVRTIIEG